MKFRLFGLALSLFVAFAFTACQGEGSETAKTDDAAVEAATKKIDAKKAEKPAADPVADLPKTSIEFDETVFDFGQIKDGEKVRHTYKFTNTGNEPLVLSNCKGSCGCTVPQCPKEAFAPGESGEIVVEYNSRNKGNVEGKLDQKFITVTANTEPAQSRLTIKGIVKKEEPAS